VASPCVPFTGAHCLEIFFGAARSHRQCDSGIVPTSAQEVLLLLPPSEKADGEDPTLESTVRNVDEVLAL
jgi:hypothetical protein